MSASIRYLDRFVKQHGAWALRRAQTHGRLDRDARLGPLDLASPDRGMRGWRSSASTSAQRTANRLQMEPACEKAPFPRSRPAIESQVGALDAERRQAMSYSISTLLTRNLHDVFGENDPARRRAAIDEMFAEDCVFHEPKGVYRGRDQIASQARSGRHLTLTFGISKLPRLKNWAMSGGSNGYRAVLVRRRPTPGLISSLPGTAGLPLSISFSTSYLELHFAARRHGRTNKRHSTYEPTPEARKIGHRRPTRRRVLQEESAGSGHIPTHTFIPRDRDNRAGECG